MSRRFTDEYSDELKQIKTAIQKNAVEINNESIKKSLAEHMKAKSPPPAERDLFNEMMEKNDKIKMLQHHVLHSTADDKKFDLTEEDSPFMRTLVTGENRDTPGHGLRSHGHVEEEDALINASNGISRLTGENPHKRFNILEDIGAGRARRAKVVCPKQLKERISKLSYRNTKIAINETRPVDTKAIYERRKKIKQRAAILRNEQRTPLIKEVPFGKSGTFADNGKTFHDDMNEFRKERLSYSGIKIRPRNPKKQMPRIISAALRSETNKEVQAINVLKKKIKTALLHPKAEKILKERYKIIQEPDESTLIDPEGNILKHRAGFTHFDQAHESAVELEIPLAKNLLGDPQASDESLHEFLKKTGTVRVQKFPAIQRTSFHIPNKLTIPQIKTIKDLAKFNPNEEIGFAIGQDFGFQGRDLKIGEGINELFREHSKIFGYKGAQEDVDTNVNMTYKKSKPHKMFKELFPDQRSVKSAAQEVIHPSIEKFKKHKLTAEHDEGFGFDPRHDDFLTPSTARERYGKPGTSLHFIATTDNSGSVENIAKNLDIIGEQHFIGGWRSSTGYKTDASYIINTNDTQEVIGNLTKHNQEASYSLDPEGRPFFVRNPNFKSH